MLIWTILFSLLTSAVFADAGKVTKIVGSDDAYLIRGTQKIPLIQDTGLEVGDEVFSSNAHVVFFIHPASQFSMTKQSQLKITQAEVDKSNDKVIKASSVLDLVKGLIRVLVTKQYGLEVEQKITSSNTNVAFAVRGTEFEVGLDDEGAQLDVFEGEVEVSSPEVNTFVPEIIKANEGFKFLKRQKQFVRRKVASRFKDHPGFLNKIEMKKRWQNKTTDRRTKKRVKREKRPR